jgi:hypothetical protein
MPDRSGGCVTASDGAGYLPYVTIDESAANEREPSTLRNSKPPCWLA